MLDWLSILGLFLSLVMTAAGLIVAAHLLAKRASACDWVGAGGRGVLAGLRWLAPHGRAVISAAVAGWAFCLIFSLAVENRWFAFGGAMLFYVLALDVSISATLARGPRSPRIRFDRRTFGRTSAARAMCSLVLVGTGLGLAFATRDPLALGSLFIGALSGICVGHLLAVPSKVAER